MKKLFSAFGLILVLSMVLAACGGGTGSGGANTLNITLTDFAYSPSSWSVTAGSSVTVTLNNTGAAQHTWTVMSKAISGSFSDTDKANILFNSGLIDAGASKTVTFTAPAAGNYQVICTQAGHFENGMIGQLTVK